MTVEGTVVDLDRQIWHLRSAGLTAYEVAQMLEMESNDVIRRFREYQLHLAKDVSLKEREQIVQLELSRLDALQYPQWAKAMEGDAKAVEAILKIMNTRIKLLGLDMANPDTESGRNQILVVGTSREEFIEALANGKSQLTGRPDDDEGDEED